MKINPKQLEKAMKQLGVKSEEIEAEEVIIKTPEKDIVISNAQVSRINMMGQESFQISGDISERPREKFTLDDIKMIMEKTGASVEEAAAALEKTGDIAEAILRLKGKE